jgi:hypothetical protein
MRVALIVIVTVAALLGGLYGFGFFLLPNTLQVSSSVTIERPRAMVYTLVSHVSLVREWSPYWQRDPEAEYFFSGEDGQVGQTMRWRSSKNSVGSGSLSVLEMVPGERVSGRLELDNRARLETAFLVEAGETGATATWQVSGSCDPGLVNILCRYANLVLSPAIKNDLDEGLEQLKRLAEDLPNVDFGGIQLDIVSIPPRRYIFDDIQVSADTARSSPEQFAEALRNAEQSVLRFFAEYQFAPDSPSRIVVTTQDDGEYFKFRVGQFYSGPTPLVLTGVESGETPAGRMARVVFRGPRAGMPQAYEQVDAYMQTRRIERRGDGLPWEVYAAQPAPLAATPVFDTPGASASGADTATITAPPVETTVQVEIFIPIQ